MAFSRSAKRPSVLKRNEFCLKKRVLLKLGCCELEILFCKMVRKEAKNKLVQLTHRGSNGNKSSSSLLRPLSLLKLKCKLKKTDSIHLLLLAAMLTNNEQLYNPSNDWVGNDTHSFFFFSFRNEGEREGKRGERERRILRMSDPPYSLKRICFSVHASFLSHKHSTGINVSESLLT